ncbi:MAG TPA: PH domain-containing protein [Solirubrobacterales bacterium]|nr:PH domain-containing protein [Solirubrobacterales bacterium]
MFSTVGLTGLGIFFTAQRGDLRWIFLGLPFTLVLFVAGRFAPTGYRLGLEGVRIERRAGAKVIPYRAIRGVDREPRRTVGMSMLGSNGVFGRFGRFWNLRLGFYQLWLSNTRTVVWLHASDGLIALSPDRPDEFVARLRARLPRDRSA